MVWEILCSIPYGKTMTYGEIARQIAFQKGIPHMSAQAVGGAVGHNKISILVPCHRVVGTNGSLTGYAGGMDKKVKLLTLEGVDCHASNYSSHLRQLYRRLNPTSPLYHLSQRAVFYGTFLSALLTIPILSHIVFS